MDAQVESLNVSVASGISIYELKFKQILSMLKEKISSDFGRQINVIGRLIQMIFDSEIKKLTDLSGMQVILMMIMYCDTKMTLENISSDVGLFSDELNDFLEPLIQSEYISFKDNFYAVSPKGENFLAEIWPIVDKSYQKIFLNFEKKEIMQLKNLLSKLESNCLSLADQNNK